MSLFNEVSLIFRYARHFLLDRRQDNNQFLVTSTESYPELAYKGQI